jgi:hypothetical protein
VASVEDGEQFLRRKRVKVNKGRREDGGRRSVGRTGRKRVSEGEQGREKGPVPFPLAKFLAVVR